MQGSPETLWQFIKELLGRIGRNDLGAYAAALSYNFIFAVFPLVLSLLALFSFFHLSGLVAFESGPLATLIPVNALTLLINTLSLVVHRESPAVLGVGLVGFVWGMAGAFRQIIDAVNHAYEYPHPYRRKFWQVYILSIVLGITVGLLIVSGIILSVTGEHLLANVVWALWRVTVAVEVVDAIRWATLIVLFAFILAILYAVTPDEPRRFRLLTPGAAVVLVAWVLMSVGFSFYVAHFHTYNQIYGTLGSVILLLLYLYFFGFLILIGAQINAMLEKRR